MAARGGYQIPADLHPVETRCVTFELPADLFYIANFWGAIGELAKWTSYTHTGDDSGAQAASVMAKVIDAARENFLNVCNEQMEEPEREIIREIIYQLARENDDDEGCDDMCVKCGNGVYYDLEKKSLYYIDAGCNKVYVEALGVVDDNTGAGEWNGEQPAPESPNVPHDNPLYQSADSLRCAKATALVDEMWNVLAVHESIEEISTFLATVTAISDAIATFAPFPPARATALIMANTLHGLVQQMALAEVKEEFETITDDLELKNNLICDIVPRMTTPVPGLPFGTGILTNRLEAADIKVAIERFDALLGEEIDHDNAMVWLNVFPISSWQEIVTEKISETECGCDNFKPYQPAPDPSAPPDDGCIKVYPGVRALAPYDGQNLSAPISYWTEFELFGTFENGEILTGAAGDNGAGSDLFRGGAIFEIDEGAEIIEVRWDWSSPYTQGTSGRNYQFSVYTWASEGANSVVSYDVTVTGGTGASVVVPVAGTWVARSHISIGAFLVANGGSVNQVRVRNIQFHIKSEALGFDGWVSAGQDLCD